jgi:nitrogen fixation/metabolism regulation signal transduction histidine kinase
MKIRRKLLLSYLLIVALFVAAGATLTYNTMKMAELQSTVKQQVEINDNAYAYAQGIDQKQFGMMVYANVNPTEGVRITVASAETIVKAQTYLQSALTSDPALLGKFNEVVDIDKNTIDPAIAQINILYTNQTGISENEQLAQIWTQLTTLMNGVSQADGKLADVRSATMANVQTATTTSQNYANFSTILAVAFIAAMTTASVAMAITMGNRITRPLKKLADIAQKVSLGDLNQRHYLKENIDIKTGDEIDELVDSFRRMINAFRMSEALISEPEVEVAQ